MYGSYQMHPTRRLSMNEIPMARTPSSGHHCYIKFVATENYLPMGMPLMVDSMDNPTGLPTDSTSTWTSLF